eukprot:3591776-Amphidinium_carterae.2
MKKPERHTKVRAACWLPSCGMTKVARSNSKMRVHLQEYAGSEVVCVQKGAIVKDDKVCSIPACAFAGVQMIILSQPEHKRTYGSAANKRLLNDEFGPSFSKNRTKHISYCHTQMFDPPSPQKC